MRICFSQGSLMVLQSELCNTVTHGQRVNMLNYERWLVTIRHHGELSIWLGMLGMAAQGARNTLL
jgi:hypothetical protein